MRIKSSVRQTGISPVKPSLLGYEMRSLDDLRKPISHEPVTELVRMAAVGGNVETLIVPELARVRSLHGRDILLVSRAVLDPRNESKKSTLPVKRQRVEATSDQARLARVVGWGAES